MGIEIPTIYCPAAQRVNFWEPGDCTDQGPLIIAVRLYYANVQPLKNYMSIDALQVRK